MLDGNTKVFAKEFKNFEEGIKDLAELSYSAEQALTALRKSELPLEEDQATANLSANVIFDRPTGDGDNWNEACIDVSSFGVTYRTTGGLIFGWSVVFERFGDDFNYSYSFHDGYVFFIRHPKAPKEVAAPRKSSLRESAEKLEWKEISYEWLEYGGHSPMNKELGLRDWD